MRLMITGASGLVGKAVSRYSSAMGFMPVPVTRNLVPDLASKDAINHLNSLGQADAIVHCAARIPVGKCSAGQAALENAAIDDNIANYVQQNQIPIVFISSTSIYAGWGKSSCLVESSPTVKSVVGAPPYSVAKCHSEELLSQISQCTILRISSPYGLFQKNRNVLSIFIENALNGQELNYFGDGSRTQDFIHADDIATAVLASLKNKRYGVYNIVSSSPISMKELALLVASLAPHTSLSVRGRGEDPQEDFRANFSNEKAANILGWNPRYSLVDGIKQMMQVGSI